MEVFEQLLNDYAGDVDFEPSAFYKKIMSGLVYWEDLKLNELHIDINLDKNERINKTVDMQNILIKLSQLTMEDPLTGLYNRRYFNQTLKMELERNYRDNRTLALAIIDIDHFKNINDTYGHDGGDAVLRAIASEMKKSIRQSDALTRIGGEEFAIIMPNIRHHLAKEVMERLRRNIESSEILIDGQTINITVSIGTAVSEPNLIISADDLYNLSDRALYQAKHSGRNNVVIYGTPITTQLSASEREALM